MGEAQTKKHADPLHDVKIEVIIDTGGGVEASKLVKTWADTVIKVDTRKMEDTLRQLEADALINTPGDALQPVTKMMRHSHGKTTFLASNRSWSQVCEI